MKYIYYTIGILVFFTGIMAVKFTNFKVEVSKPAIIINDRVISEKELEGFFTSSAYSNHTTGVIDAVITNELLIQEAIAHGINKEESFRASVENFYEQSLIKSLIDRKFASIKPEITSKMIDQYVRLSGKDVVYTKMSYENIQDVENGKIKSLETITSNFDDLSGELKYTMILLEKGRTSDPVNRGKQYVCYRLDSYNNAKAQSEPEHQDPSGSNNVPDLEEIREFLTHQQKGALFARWMDDLTKNAHILILTDRSQNKEEQ